MGIDHAPVLAAASLGCVALLARGFRSVPDSAVGAWMRRRCLPPSADGFAAAASYLRRQRRGLAIGASVGIQVGVVSTLIEPAVVLLVWLGIPGALVGMAVAGLVHRAPGRTGAGRRIAPEPLSRHVPTAMSWVRRLAPVILLAAGAAGVGAAAVLTPSETSPDPLPPMHLLAAAAVVYWAVIAGTGVALVAELALRWRARRLSYSLSASSLLSASSDVERAVHAAGLRRVEWAALGLQSLLVAGVGLAVVLAVDVALDMHSIGALIRPRG